MQLCAAVLDGATSTLVSDNERDYGVVVDSDTTPSTGTSPGNDGQLDRLARDVRQ
ncbi:MAG: hypothetical protein ACRDP8_00760 [Actinopolymorphaceae bacterium]